MVWRRSWRRSSWISENVSVVVQLLGLPCVRHFQLMCKPVLNRACHWNTCAQLKVWSLKAGWINLRVFVALFPRLAQNFMHTRCSFLWSIVKIATCHIHDSKQRRVKTSHFQPVMCNLANWLIKRGSPTVYRCFALPQLLYRWQH